MLIRSADEWRHLYAISEARHAPVPSMLWTAAAAQRRVFASHDSSNSGSSNSPLNFGGSLPASSSNGSGIRSISVHSDSSCNAYSAYGAHPPHPSRRKRRKHASCIVRIKTRCVHIIFHVVPANMATNAIVLTIRFHTPLNSCRDCCITFSN